MKRGATLVCTAVLATICLLSVTSAVAAPTSPTIITPDALKWTPVAGMTGAESANLSGDMNKPGIYTVRLKLVDGFKLPLHWHPTDERATILSGTLQFYTHDDVNGTKMTVLPAGSFVFIPAGAHHYIIAKGETVIQITSTGPFVMNVVK